MHAGAFKPGALDPGMDDGASTGGLHVESARDEVLPLPRLDFRKPVSDRGSGLLGDFELDLPAYLRLDDSGAVSRPTTGANIFNLQPHEVAAPELANDGKIEKREVPRSVLQPKPHPDGPNLRALGYQAATRKKVGALRGGGYLGSI
jgi:hypothetical protein